MDKLHKSIHDEIHGLIKISDIACRIIDTPEFQRLRYLRQLGTCYYVFPSAKHTRFEHSLGTYHLTGRLASCLKQNSDSEKINQWLNEIPELKGYYARTSMDDKFDDYVIELIKIAGLCHDIGHGPFSHVYDDVFVPTIRTGEPKPTDIHEARSGMILEKIIKRDPVLTSTISNDEIRFIQDLINPQKHQIGFMYQIVSNNINNVDVDKFDYITRDTHNLGLKFGFNFERIINDVVAIDNNVCYLNKMYFELASMFTTRYRLHKQVYTHKGVIATQYLLGQMMCKLEPLLHMYAATDNMDDFCGLTDEYILIMLKYFNSHKNQYSDDEQKLIDDAMILLDRIQYRKLPKLIGRVVSKRAIRIIDEDLYPNNVDDPRVYVCRLKIGLVSGNKSNPFENMYFYERKNKDTCFKIQPEDVSFLLPDSYQEYIHLIFAIDRDDHEFHEQMNVRLAEIRDKLGF